MGFLILFFIIAVILVPIVWWWIKGFDYMDKNHPEYKGNDLI
jgi:hypothetical protein